MRLVGYPISPYVRKVRLTLEHKEIPYELDPLNPFTEKERILQLNPEGAVPVLIADEKKMAESSDICHWLDEHQPSPEVYPTDPEIRKRAEELEVWADGTLVRDFGGGMFFQRVVKPFYLQKESDESRVEKTLTERAPAVLSELENILNEEGFAAGARISVADFAITSWLRAGMLTGLIIDRSKYRKTFSYLTRVYQSPAYQRVIGSEDSLEVIQFAKQKYGTGPTIIE